MSEYDYPNHPTEEDIIKLLAEYNLPASQAYIQLVLATYEKVSLALEEHAGGKKLHTIIQEANLNWFHSN